MVANGPCPQKPQRQRKSEGEMNEVVATLYRIILGHPDYHSHIGD